MNQSSSNQRIGIQFVALAVVWGSSFLFIKLALDGLSPAQVAFGRLAFGAVTLALLMVITRRRWPTGVRTWAHLGVIGVLLCVVPFLLFSWAGQYIPSGLSSIYNATTPVATLLVSLALLPSERLTRPRVIGLLLAGVGVVVVAAPWRYLGSDAWSGHGLIAQAACLAATLSYGFAFAYTRRFLSTATMDPTAVAASQIGIAAVILGATMPWIGMDAVDLSPTVLISMIVLGAVGTGLAYVWNTRIIQSWGATIASSVTYLTPVVGVLLGVLVLRETLHWHEPAGAVLVLLGVVVSQGRTRSIVDWFARKRPSRAATPSA